MTEPFIRIVSLPFQIPALTAILLIKAYQRFVSPLLGNNCRFHPSCSEYFVRSLQKHGLLLGGWRGIRRICRCHPFDPGGYDPP
ncbi:MAG: membrane protein insertion efficiency factor YidD [Planctomycetaceae bacterium]|nr:membrane protein insertion efficiency factor YidD [Planctomycetaceae bacterium]